MAAEGQPDADTSPRLSRRQLTALFGLVVAGSAGGGVAAWETTGLRDLWRRWQALGQLPCIDPQWSAQKELPSTTPAVSFAEDPNAGSNVDSWRKVGVVLFAAGNMRYLLQTHQGSIPTFAFRDSSGLWRTTPLAPLAELGRVDFEDTNYVAVGPVIGNGSLTASLGVEDTAGNFHSNQFSLRRHPTTTTLADMSGDFPGVPALSTSAYCQQ